MFSRDQLFELVWGSFGDRSTVAVYIGRLRQKIEPDPAKPRYIVTVWGAGYRLDPGQQMRRPPIRIRTFILGTILVLLLVPTLAAGAAWLIERDHQQADLNHRLNTALAYLTSHRNELRESAAGPAFAPLLERLGLLAQLVVAGPDDKNVVYVSPTLEPAQAAQDIDKAVAAKRAAAGRAETSPAGWVDVQRLIPIPASRPRVASPATLVADLYYRPASSAIRALVALSTRNRRPPRRPRGRGLARRPLDGHTARQPERPGRQGRGRRLGDRCPGQPDRRDREHRSGG